MNVHRAEVVSLAARYRVPTVYPWRYFTELGGLCHMETSNAIHFDLLRSMLIAS
jgi:hypothetical protein